MAERQIKSKLVLKDLGNPKAILAMPGEKARHVLGIILGRATGVGRKSDAKDPTKFYEFLKGDFEGVPSDANEDTTASGVLYLPDGIHNMIASKLQGEDAASAVDFAIEVATIKASNPIGYTWAFTPKVQAQESDVLAELRKAAGLTALPAPEKSEGKKK